MAKERLDVLLVARNLIDTREKAKRLIMAGLVYSDNERMDKPGMKVDTEIPLKIKGRLPYVSRGGYKLEKALKTFDTTIANKIMIDIGASTGGFTDCALQNGASKVYAIDVGYNQLDWKLRSDKRVSVHERTNFKYVTKDLFTNGIPNYATIDVSFISLRLIFPTLKTILQENSEIIALVKPQFEAEREQVGKKGVIRDPKIHEEVLNKVFHYCQNEDFQLLNMSYSPITGAEGNIEYLYHLGHRTDKEEIVDITKKIADTVKEAHEQLTQK